MSIAKTKVLLAVGGLMTGLSWPAVAFAAPVTGNSVTVVQSGNGPTTIVGSSVNTSPGASPTSGSQNASLGGSNTPGSSSLPFTLSGSSSASSASNSTSSLPFTGLDVEELLAVGLLALGAGGLMVRKARTSASA